MNKFKFIFARDSLFVKLITRFLVILFLLSLLIQITSFAQYGRATRKFLSENYFQMLSHTESNIDLLNRQIIHMISQFDLNSDLNYYLSEPITEQFMKYRMVDKMNTYLSTFSALFDSYKIQVVLIGQNGQVYTNNNQLLAMPIEDIYEQPFVKEALSNYRKVFYKTGRHGITTETQFSNVTLISKAIHNMYTDKLYGILIVSIDEEAFYKTYNKLLNRNNRFVIVKPDGYVLSDSVRSNVGKKMPELYDIALKQQDLAIDKHNIEYNNKKYIAMSKYIPLYDCWLIEFSSYDLVNKENNIILFNISMISLVFIFISLLFTFYSINSVTTPINKLSELMFNFTHNKNPERINFKGCREVEIVSEAFNSMLDEINNYIEKLNLENEAKRQSELTSLQMQIKPHFLYNTLTSIKYLTIYGKKNQAVEAISALIQLLRKTIGDSNELIPLSEELMLVKYYMIIQRFRYGDGVHLVVNVDTSLELYQIPKLILQPLIENSIFHGFTDTNPRGTISIFSHLEEDKLIIDVIDNGNGIPPETLATLLEYDSVPEKGKFFGIGVKNVDERIKLIYGNNFGLSIISELNFGTQITIKLPAIKMENTDPAIEK